MGAGADAVTEGPALAPEVMRRAQQNTVPSANCLKHTAQPGSGGAGGVPVSREPFPARSLPPPTTHSCSQPLGAAQETLPREGLGAQLFAKWMLAALLKAALDLPVCVLRVLCECYSPPVLKKYFY